MTGAWLTRAATAQLDHAESPNASWERIRYEYRAFRVSGPSAYVVVLAGSVATSDQVVPVLSKRWSWKYCSVLETSCQFSTTFFAGRSTVAVSRPGVPGSAR